MRKQLPALAFALFFAFGAKAQLPGWNHILPISVIENSGNTIPGYQVRLEINTQTMITASEMQADGSDIRFGNDCAGSMLYNYWIESGINTPNTVIWVKLDTIFSLAAKPLYMYYGNAAATGISSINGTFYGPNSSTDSTTNGNAGGVTDSQRGFRFSSSEDILVTAFGKNEPNGTTRYVTLFDFTTQAILRQQQVSGPGAQFSYNNLSNPIWLTAGTQYLLEIHQNSTDGYYFGAAPVMGTLLTYYDMRYCNGCDQNTFPTNSLGGMLYGYVDMWYYYKTTVTPAPTVVYEMPLTVLLPSDTSVCYGDSITMGTAINGGVAPYAISWQPSLALSDSNDANPVASPLADITYTLTVTDAGGCFHTAQRLIDVNAQLIASAGGDQQLCFGDTATLSGGNGNYAFGWNNNVTNNVPFIPDSTETYVLTATDSVGCTLKDSVEIVVHPLPVVSFTPPAETSLCTNAPAIILNGTPAGGTFSGPGVTGNAFTAATAGTGIHTLTYTYTTAQGCSNDATIQMNIAGCVGLDEENSPEVRVYPNPADQFVFVEIAAPMTVTIFSIDGKSVRTIPLSSGTSSLSLTGMAPGTYQLHFEENGIFRSAFSLIKR